MAVPDLRARLREPEPYYFAWTLLPGVLHAQAVSRLPFEGVCLDTQHGLIGFSDVASMVPAINRAGKASIVRLLWNDPGLIGQALGTGAACIIAPMVNTAADAERLVTYAKYPPLGGRSWGSYAMTQHEGYSKERFLADANRLTVVFAMVETAEALDNLEAICGTKGIDGIFVGPSDLTISLSKGTSLDFASDLTQSALTKIAATVVKHDLVPGVFGGTAEFSKSCVAKGYRFLASGSDTVMMDAGARAFLAGARG